MIYMIDPIFIFLVEANRSSIFTTNALSDRNRVEQERLQAEIISLNTQIKVKSQVSDFQNFYPLHMFLRWGVRVGVEWGCRDSVEG